MDDSPTEIEFELERAYDREELAAVFREFAAALADDRPLKIDDGDRTAAVSIPERVVAEFEAECEDDEPPVAELELELEWDDPDGSTIRLGDSERETPGVVGAEPAGEGEPETDPAAATMPPEAVSGGSDADDSSSDRTSRFEVYEDRGGQWRWRLVHWNGNIVADSGEGYSSRSNAKRAARSVMRSAPTASVEDRED
ncbi:amphi-Trp domain-containing protein [Haloterrigena salinisoli]|uniref:amphi-Trp domain-containing protein n=1 Tax=Haloterrigena salinisoli TaxID=3132747 RepID=UPI0030D52FDD